MNKHLTYLEGLRIIPFGLYAILLSLWQIWLHTIVQGNPTILFILTLLVLAGIALLTDQYYRRTVRTITGNEISLQEAIQWRGTLILFFLLYLFGTSIDLQGGFPVSMFGLIVAVTMCIYWWQTGRILVYYIFLAPLITGLSLLPLIYILWDVPIFFTHLQYLSILQFIIGFSFITVGISEHLLFLKNIKES